VTAAAAGLSRGVPVVQGNVDPAVLHAPVAEVELRSLV